MIAHNDAKNYLGVYTDLSSDDYHNDKTSVSRSVLMDFKKSPKKCWAKNYAFNRPTEEPTPAMKFGTAFHTLVLEPNLFSENYFILPRKVLLKDVGREKYDEFKKVEKEADTTSKSVLSFEEFEKLLEMQKSLLANQKANELIKQGIYESSYFWEDKDSGLIVKSRPDILHDKIYVDLKTVSDASPHTYQKEMALYGYHLQSAMVCDGVLKLQEKELLACINVCVEKTYPYSVGIYIIDESAIQAGREEYRRLLLDMKTCILNDDFPDYEPQTIGLPRWAI